MADSKKECSVLFCKSDDSVPMIGYSRKRAKEWDKLCGIIDGTPSKKKYVCVKHFNKSDFYNRLWNRLELKSGIDPYLNLPSSNASDIFREYLALKKNYLNLQSDNDKLREQLKQTHYDFTKFKLFFGEKEDEVRDLKSKILSQKRSVDFYSEFLKINPIIQELVLNEIKNQNLKRRGRRFSEEIKLFCLYTHLSSPKTYKVFQSIFTWPSADTICDLINSEFMKTDLSDAIIEYIKKSNFDPKIWSLLLDENHLKLFHEYNSNELTDKGTESSNSESIEKEISDSNSESMKEETSNSNNELIVKQSDKS